MPPASISVALSSRMISPWLPMYTTLVLCVLALALPPGVSATAVAQSELHFFNVQITPVAGTLEFLGPPWTAEAFAQAQNSLGALDAQFDSSVGGVALANATVTYANGHGDASAITLTGNANSQVNIPGCDVAAAFAVGRGAIFNAFRITGGTGAVAVDFSVDIAGDLLVQTDACGVLAQTETIFAWELFGLDSTGTPITTPILFRHDILTIGPNDMQTTSFATTLSTRLTLAFFDPAQPSLFVYDTRLEADAESTGINAPEPATFVLLLSGCVGLLLTTWVRHRRARS